MSNINNKLALIALCLVFSLPQHGMADEILNSIVADVHHEPISLKDISENNKVNIKENEFFLDNKDKNYLEREISYKLIEKEAKKNRLSVSDEEVNSAFQEIAKRNKLKISDFEKALVSAGKTSESFKGEIKKEILTSKVARLLVQDGVSVSDTEIDQYIENNKVTSEGDSVELQHIIIGFEDKTKSEAQSIITNVIAKVNNGESFSKLATKVSDAPDASEGGNLGEVSVNDLNPHAFNAIKHLQVGEMSEIITGNGFLQIFRLVNKKEKSIEITEEMRKQAKAQVERQKMEEKLKTIFEKELHKLYPIDRKY